MDALSLFVYGSLKRGECNHEVVEPWLLDLLPARARGRLFLRPDGYPALWVDRFLAAGSSDYVRDLGLWLGQQDTHGDGATVQGQLLRLEPTAEALRRLDEFEGFAPGRPSSYRRVLVRVLTPTGSPSAWTYICPESGPVAGSRPIGCWPPPDAQGPPAPYTGGCR